MKIALVTAIAAFAQDDDLAPLYDAMIRAGLKPMILAWDDGSVSWSRFDLALLRSPWDYTERLPEFLAWAERVSKQTTLLNPLSVIRHNTDKHYLAELAKAGVPVVPTSFAEPGDEAGKVLDAFLARHPDATEFVIKPAVSAGSRDTQRYPRHQRDDAQAHIVRLLDGQRSVLMQPYLPSVDSAGETALIFFNGQFSHAIRKGPLLKSGDAPTDQLFAAEETTPRVPGDDEMAIATAVLAAQPEPLAYARVDLIRDADGSPQLLELELTEPSLFFRHSDGAADRFVAQLLQRLSN